MDPFGALFHKDATVVTRFLHELPKDYGAGGDRHRFDADLVNKSRNNLSTSR